MSPAISTVILKLKDFSGSHVHSESGNTFNSEMMQDRDIVTTDH